MKSMKIEPLQILIIPEYFKQDYTTVTASSMNHHHHMMMHYLSEQTHVSDILTINQTPRDSNHHHRTYVTYTPYPSTDPQKQNGSLRGFL